MLSTTLCSIPLKSPLGNASGCYSSTLEELTQLDQICGFITSKSCTIHPKQGNTKPRLYIDDNICINNMGLPNNGITYYDQSFNNPYILSVYAHTVNELDELFQAKNNIIEVNLSCPNVNNLIDYEVFLSKINQIKGNKIVGVKLPPIFNKQQIITLSELLLKYQINFITCSNTIPNCLVLDDDTPVIYGSTGSTSLKAISLSNVYQFYKLLGNKIDIIGCGGIKSGQDVYEYILCGATCVQIGSQLLREGIEAIKRIEQELTNIMHEKQYTCINDFKGCVKECTAKL